MAYLDGGECDAGDRLPILALLAIPVTFCTLALQLELLDQPIAMMALLVEL